MNFKKHNFIIDDTIRALPLFTPDNDHAPLSEQVIKWRKQVLNSQAIIISTPAYLFNIPAVLKNSLEWLTSSGELDGKPALAITYTPHPPRGMETMQSLIWSLNALNARVVAQCPLYQNEIRVGPNDDLVGSESIELLQEAFNLLVG